MSLAPSSFLRPAQSRDYSLLLISGTVIFLHLVLLLWALLVVPENRSKSISPIPKRFVVQTVALTPQNFVRINEEPIAAMLPPSIEKPVENLPMKQENLEIVPDPKPVEKTELPLEKTEAAVPEISPVIEKKIENQPTSNEIPLQPPPKSPLKLEEPKASTETPKPKAPLPKKIEPSKNPAKPPAPIKKPSISSEKPIELKEKSKPVPKEKLPEKKPKEVSPVKTAPTIEEKAAAELKKKKEQEQIALKARQKELLAQAQEKIAKIAQSRDKVSPSKLLEGTAPALPTAITSLQIDAFSIDGGTSSLSDGEITYRDELAGRLKLLLRLPEYGEVKIKLTLECAGKVVKVVVVSAESAANRKHIEKMLPSLTFPSFGAHFGDAQQYTFSITLSNEL